MLCFCMNWTPATLHVSRNSFPCHTSEKSPRNSNHCHTSKTAVFNPCVCHTSETPRGPLFQLGTSPLACQTSSSLFSSDSALFAKNHPGWGYPCSIAFRGECPQGSNRRTCKPSALRSVVSSLGADARKSRL